MEAIYFGARTAAQPNSLPLPLPLPRPRPRPRHVPPRSTSAVG
jgi:hypothetical protein